MLIAFALAYAYNIASAYCPRFGCVYFVTHKCDVLQRLLHACMHACICICICRQLCKELTRSGCRGQWWPNRTAIKLRHQHRQRVNEGLRENFQTRWCGQHSAMQFCEQALQSSAEISAAQMAADGQGPDIHIELKEQHDRSTSSLCSGRCCLPALRTRPAGSSCGQIARQLAVTGQPNI